MTACSVGSHSGEATVTHGGMAAAGEAHLASAGAALALTVSLSQGAMYIIKHSMAARWRGAHSEGQMLTKTV